MKRQAFSPMGQTIFIALVALSLALIAITRTPRVSSSDDAAKRKAAAEHFREIMSRGVGSEVMLASANARPEDVRASVDSAMSFIHYRSGLTLNAKVVDRLAAMEASTLKGDNRRISAEDLSEVLAPLAVERFRTLTDDEIEHAADAFSNVKVIRPPGQPNPTSNPNKQGKGSRAQLSAKNTQEDSRTDAEKDDALDDIMLRRNGPAIIHRRKFIEVVKTYRQHLQVALATFRLPIMTMASQAAEAEVKSRLKYLSSALPEQWGRAEREGMTPVQALLIVYSAVSDDYLGESKADLQSAMQWLERTRSETRGSYASSDGRFAYGVDGYLFSTPLDLAFDQQTTMRLLGDIEERSSK